jgi:AcrR family transcriptional regulator
VAQGPEIPQPRFGPYEEPSDSFSLRILDAAYAEFLSLGLRRATLDGIAQRAGVGRMTLHRRYPAKQELIEAVFERENSRILDAIGEVAMATPTVTEAMVESLALGIERIRSHPLFARLLETDREAAVPFLTFEAGPLMVESTRYIVSQLERVAAPADSYATEVAAEAIIRVCHSVLLAPDGLHNLLDARQLREFLRPVIGALASALG